MSFHHIFSNKIFKNFSYLTIGSVIGQLFSLVAIFLLTKLIKPEFYGLYTYLISQGLLLVRVSSLGNNNIVVRRISRDPSSTKNIAFSTLIYRLIIIVLSSALYIVYDYFFSQLDAVQLLLLIVYTLISSISFIIEWAFTGQQKLKTVAFINASTNLVWLLLVVFVVTEESRPTDIFFLYVASQTVKMVLYMIMSVVNKIFKGQRIHNVFKEGFSINRESWPYFAMFLLLLPLSNLDNNFLDINSTDLEKGYFNLAKRLIGPLSLMNTMLVTAIFPNMSAMWVGNKDRFKRFVTKGFPIFIVLGALICFSFSLFCEEVVALLFDKEYLPAVLVCQIQVWYFLFFSIDFLMGTFLGASNREKTILKFAVIYCLVCSPAMFFGSYYGAVGISVALLVSYLCAMIFTWSIFKSVIEVNMKSCNPSYLITGILMISSLLITQLYPLNFLTKTIIFLLVIIFVGRDCYQRVKALKV